MGQARLASSREGRLLAPLLTWLAVQSVAAERPAEAPAPASPAAEVYGPATPARPKAAPKPAAAESCNTPALTEPGEIIVCAQKPQGYRIDPDILTAKRAVRNQRQRKRPERFADTSCTTVGPMGCGGAGAVSIFAAAVGAATMLKKAVNGENVGKMFVTNPQLTEFELYQQAKREREAKEAAEAAKAEQKAALEAAGR